MTAITAGTAQKLLVIPSVASAYRNVLGRPLAVGQVAALPGAVSAAIAYAIASSPLWGQTWGILAFLLLIMPLSYLAQSWLRHRLLGESAQPRLASEQLRCYGRLLCIGTGLSVWLLCMPICAILGGALLLRELVDEPWRYASYLSNGVIASLLWIGLMALFALPVGRFFSFVPAVAIGQMRSPRTLWRSSSGHGLRISLALILLMFTFAIVQICLLLSFLLVAAVLNNLLGHYSFFPQPDDLTSACGLATLFIGALLGTTLSAELLAIAFRNLTGWGGPQMDILERFD